MALIYIGTKQSKKQKKKPGWKQREAEYQAWLNKHTPTKEDLKRLAAAKQALAKKSSTRGSISSSQQVVSRMENFSSSQRETEREKVASSSSSRPEIIHDPRVLYKDNPEMLERELKARARKFNTAPVYNKGGDVYVTDEMMKDIMNGLTRRRN